MNPAIPWYQSPVMVATVVSILSQVLVLVGKADLVPADVLTQKVEAIFQIVAIVSIGWAAFKRWRSSVQPLALTQAAADVKTQKMQSHPVVAVVVFLLTLFAVSQLTACASMAIGHAKTNQQKAAALLGDFGIYQRASLRIGEDQTVPVEVRRKVLEAQVAAKPVADKLDDALTEYRHIEGDLSAGTTRDEKLRIAAANLSSWIQQLTPLVRSLRETVEAVAQ